MLTLSSACFLPRRPMASLRRSSKMKSSPAHTRLDITVASATPFAVMPSPSTKRRFSPTFMMPEAVRHSSGVLESP